MGTGLESPPSENPIPQLIHRCKGTLTIQEIVKRAGYARPKKAPAQFVHPSPSSFTRFRTPTTTSPSVSTPCMNVRNRKRRTVPYGVRMMAFRRPVSTNVLSLRRTPVQRERWMETEVGLPLYTLATATVKPHKATTTTRSSLMYLDTAALGTRRRRPSNEAAEGRLNLNCTYK